MPTYGAFLNKKDLSLLCQPKVVPTENTRTLQAYISFPNMNEKCSNQISNYHPGQIK